MDPAIKQISDSILNAVQDPNTLGVINSGNSAVDGAFSASQNASFFDQGSKGIAVGSAQIDQNQRENAAREIKKIKEQQDDIKDPSKYKIERKADGGFAFYGPDGKEVGIDNYTKNTGVRAVDILKDSENPIDMQYLDEYDNLRGLIQAVNDGDDTFVAAFQQKNPDLAGRTPDDYMKAFTARYPHIYGTGTYEDTRRNFGKTLFQRVDPLATDSGFDLSALAG